MVPLILATLLCVSARFYARWILRRTLGLDDGIMLISALFGLSFDAAVFIMVKNGLGLHVWDFHIPMIEAVLKLRVANNCLYIATSFLTKISLCVTYLRLLPDHKSNAWFCRVAITVCAAAGLALLVAQLLYCRPLSDFWDLLKPTKRNCFPASRYDYSAKGLNALANLFVFIWPARFIWGLKLPTNKRVTLVAIFCMGSW
ncbi:hypothetical protein MPH_12869 [Macrophomina phaseolina MS6]|uniref:Rhodopsin domain-containing protein n=1 Tax=Macrophomina phaseolina (strain MS6) TaxID=1126212 RepID=K2RB52_MACPH|nr:hypothetical protein MPH_12869 [Macrophomina phaseolina MS6]